MRSLQEQVKEFCEKYALHAPLESRMLDLVTEVGEVAKEILIVTDYGTKKAPSKPPFPSSFQEEMGDLYFSLLALANLAEIDLEKTVHHVLAKYEKRFAKKAPNPKDL